MRKVIYGLGVALFTFSIGAFVYYFTRPKLTSQPVQVVQVQPVEVRREDHASTVEIQTPVEAPAPAGFSVVIKTDLGDGEPGSHTVRLSKDPVVVDDFDVPEDVDGQEISIVGGDKAAQFRIFERYRNSMTVMGEGPHLDLVDWRHFDSEWIELDQLAQRKFRTLATERMDASKFPATTQAELISAVRKRAADWPEAIELAKTCRSPHHEPCAVGVSSVYFRIDKQIGDRWITVGIVEVLIPMGC